MKLRHVLAVGAMVLMLPLAASAATVVTGELGNNDYGEMWALSVGLGGGSFSATTNGTLKDTQLFLFNNAWLGLYGNDDDHSLPVQGGGGYAATISHALAPGLYYLAVSLYDVDPMSAGGLIFPNAGPGQVAATGPGGGGAFNWTWSNPPVGYPYNGPYQITMQGVDYAEPVANPEPATMMLFGSGAAALIARARRRK